VIVPDINLLLYANNPVAREYTVAQNWVESILNGNEAVGFCWPVLSGFIRISTSPRALLDPLDIRTAIELVEDYIGRENVVILSATDRHWLIFSDLLVKAKVRGAMTSDAEIATLVIENGGTLYTTDHGFSRYPGLKFVNPLG
jgi:uncharacterized protein